MKRGRNTSRERDGYPLHQTDTGMENEITPQKRWVIGERGKEGPCDNLTEIVSIAHMAGRRNPFEIPKRSKRFVYESIPCRA